MNWSENYHRVQRISWEGAADAIRGTVSMGEAVGFYAPDPPPRGRRIPCPIHNGQDYNFSFSEHRFRCYVCGESGDVIEFVKLVCGLQSRKDAMIRINQDFRLGLPLDREASLAESRELEERRRQARARQDEEKRLLTAYHSAMDNYVFLDLLRRDFAPKDMDEEPTMQYAYACRRIAGAWHEVELALIRLQEFEKGKVVIPN